MSSLLRAIQPDQIARLLTQATESSHWINILVTELRTVGDLSEKIPIFRTVLEKLKQDTKNCNPSFFFLSK